MAAQVADTRYFCKKCNKFYDRSQLKPAKIENKSTGETRDGWAHQETSVRFLNRGMSVVETNWHLVEEQNG
jgi:hypothetical protein